MVLLYKLLLLAELALAERPAPVELPEDRKPWLPPDDIPYLPPDMRKGSLGYHINLDRFGNDDCGPGSVGETTPVSDESGCMTWGQDPGFGSFRYNWMRGGIGNHPMNAGTCVFGVWGNQGCRGNYIGTVQNANSLMTIGALKPEIDDPGLVPGSLGSCVRVGDMGLGKAKSLKLICSVHHKNDFTPMGVPTHDTIHLDKPVEMWVNGDDPDLTVLQIGSSEKEKAAHEGDDGKKFSKDIPITPMGSDNVKVVDDHGFPDGNEGRYRDEVGYVGPKYRQKDYDELEKNMKRGEVFVA